MKKCFSYLLNKLFHFVERFWLFEFFDPPRQHYSLFERMHCIEKFNLLFPEISKVNKDKCKHKKSVILIYENIQLKYTRYYNLFLTNASMFWDSGSENGLSPLQYPLQPAALAPPELFQQKSKFRLRSIPTHVSTGVFPLES